MEGKLKLKESTVQELAVKFGKIRKEKYFDAMIVMWN